MTTSFFRSSVVHLGQPDGAVLFNLSAFPCGAQSVIDNIASGQRGIYAWFRGFDLRDGEQEGLTDLFDAISAPKFQKRSGYLSPYYDVSISSRSVLPEGKRKAISTAFHRPEFREYLGIALKWSILFQAPLYIGKSIDLRARIDTHLKAESPLRNRLREASVEIDNCLLLLLPVPKFRGDDEGESDSTNSLGESVELEDELLFEEIFSRLFNPTFTLRIG
jgi:hypothetical protein